MEVLTAINPNDLLRCMNLKTCGTTDSPGDANPTSAHANTLAVNKKEIRCSCQMVIVECNKNGR
jgi:hypothetical protein